MISNRVYDVIKFLVTILLPSLATLYLSLANLWDLPDPERVVGSITLITASLGALIGVSSKKYNAIDVNSWEVDGDVVVEDTPNGLVAGFELNDEPRSILNKDFVKFRVQRRGEHEFWEE